MAFENMSFDRPSFKLGTLAAIELSGYPETHLRPFRPEHQSAVRSLAHWALRHMAINLGRLTNHSGLSKDHVSEGVVNQLVTELGEPNRLTFLVFEDKFQKHGSLLGYMSLKQTAQDKLWHRATFSALANPDGWAKWGYCAAENVFAYGLERWGISSVVQQDTRDGLTYDDDIRYPSGSYDLHHAMGTTTLQALDNTRRIYTSLFGTLTSTFHGVDVYEHKLLGKDIDESDDEVVINGLAMTRRVREDVLPFCQSAIARDVSVEVNTPRPPTLPEARQTADAFHEAGVNLQIRGSLPRASMFDGTVYWDPAFTEPKLQRLGIMKRVEATRKLPFPVIQYATLE